MSKGRRLVNFLCIMKTGAPLAGGLVLVFVISFFMSSSFCQAEDAMVLPKGRFMTCLDFQIYPSWSKQYNDQGNEEDLDVDYNRDLDKQVIPALAGFETPVISAYKASLGHSIVDFKKESVITNILLSYGVTDKFSLGLKVPYWNFTTKVKTALDNSTATVAKNPAYSPSLPTSPSNSPLVPKYAVTQAQFDALSKLTRDDILNLLSDGIPDLGPAGKGYGYKRLETWSDSGLGDIDLALKYQYLKNSLWRLGLQGGVRFPTGQEDDPDNLVDYGFGGGSYDLFLALQNDYIGFKNLVLNGSIRYTNQLPDNTVLRTPKDINQPLTDNKDLVDRDQGDILEMEFSTIYSFPAGFGLNATYGAFMKAQDSVKGASGHFTSLEAETSQIGHTFLVGASYNNISRFQQKKAWVPFQVSLSYWDRFAGRNMNKASYYSVKGALFF